MSQVFITCLSATGAPLLILIAFCVKFAIYTHVVDLSEGTKHSINAICNFVNFEEGLSIIALSFSISFSGIMYLYSYYCSRRNISCSSQPGFACICDQIDFSLALAVINFDSVVFI